MSILILHEHTLHCLNPSSVASSPDPWPLGPLDRYLARSFPVSCLYVYRATKPAPVHSPPPAIISIDRLQNSLERLLDNYPHLTGRLHTSNVDGRPEIAHLGSGALLTEAKCDEPLTTQLSFDALPQGLVSHLDTDQIESQPFFRVQHTRFTCGSIAVSVELQHDVCDAAGLFQLVHDISRVYNDESIVVPAPYIKAFPTLTQDEMTAELSYLPKHFSLCDTPVQVDRFHTEGQGKDNDAHSMPINDNEFRNLTFPKSALDDLKQAATSSDRWVSTFEALSAFIFQRTFLARHRLEGITTYTWLQPINLQQAGRSAILPERYFPNAIICPFTTLDGDTLSGPLPDIANRLHDLTHGVTADEWDNTLKWLATCDMSKVKYDFDPSKPCFRVTQWNKFDVYDGAILDGIRPAFAAPPMTEQHRVNGLAYYLPTEKDDGSLEVVMSLSRRVWNELDDDEEWKRKARGAD